MKQRVGRIISESELDVLWPLVCACDLKNIFAHYDANDICWQGRPLWFELLNQRESPAFGREVYKRKTTGRAFYGGTRLASEVATCHSSWNAAWMRLGRDTTT